MRACYPRQPGCLVVCMGIEERSHGIELEDILKMSLFVNGEVFAEGS